MKLNEAQCLAVEHFTGPLLVKAGPGSGKTRVIAYRTARLIERGVAPRDILLVTFTRKASAEMRERIASLVGADRAKRLVAGTFHSVCARMLRELDGKEARAGRDRDFTIYDGAASERLVRKAIAELELDKKQWPYKRIRSRISFAKGRGQTPEQVVLDGDPDRATWQKLWQRYEALLRICNAFDFDDLLVVATLAAEADNALGCELRSCYTHVLVDEYQDTDPIQFRLTKALSSSTGNLCVVGDWRQSIYSFRGADVTNILSFTKHFPDAKVIDLDDNYRSTATIVGAFNGLMAGSSVRSVRGGGEKVRVRQRHDSDDEAELVVREIQALSEMGTPLVECAVLYRNHYLSRAIEVGLRHAGIHYQMARRSGFYERKVTRDIFAYLRLVTNPDSDVDLERIINVPPRSLGGGVLDVVRKCKATADVSLLQCLARLVGEGQLKGKSGRSANALVLGLHRVRQVADEQTPGCLARAMNLLLEVTEYRTYLAARLAKHRKEEKTEMCEEDVESLGLLDEVVSDVRAYEQRHPDGDLSGYLEHVALMSDQDNIEGRGVVLATIHASKGLEFQRVWVLGVEKNILPSFRAETDAEVEEERRLLFVACSRTKDSLALSYVRQREVRGELRAMSPSPFLFDLPIEYTDWGSRPQGHGS